MVFSGQVVINPVTKQSLHFLVTSRASGGKEMVAGSTYNGPGAEPASHFHPHQEEFFEVLQGGLRLKCAPWDKYMRHRPRGQT